MRFISSSCNWLRHADIDAIPATSVSVETFVLCWSCWIQYLLLVVVLPPFEVKRSRGSIQHRIEQLMVLFAFDVLFVVVYFFFIIYRIFGLDAKDKYQLKTNRITQYFCVCTFVVVYFFCFSSSFIFHRFWMNRNVLCVHFVTEIDEAFITFLTCIDAMKFNTICVSPKRHPPFLVVYSIEKFAFVKNNVNKWNFQYE